MNNAYHPVAANEVNSRIEDEEDQTSNTNVGSMTGRSLVDKWYGMHLITKNILQVCIRETR